MQTLNPSYRCHESRIMAQILAHSPSIESPKLLSSVEPMVSSMQRIPIWLSRSSTPSTISLKTTRIRLTIKYLNSFSIVRNSVCRNRLWVNPWKQSVRRYTNCRQSLEWSPLKRNRITKRTLCGEVLYLSSTLRTVRTPNYTRNQRQVEERVKM